MSEQRFPFTESQLEAAMRLGVDGPDLQAVIQRGLTAEEAAALDELVESYGRGSL